MPEVMRTLGENFAEPQPPQRASLTPHNRRNQDSLPLRRQGICLLFFEHIEPISVVPSRLSLARRSAKQNRYSSNEAHLAELITHAALAEQRLAGATTGTGTASTRDGENRRRSDPPPRETPALSGRSPLEAIEHRSRDDPDWAAVHHRQAWFLQVR